MGPSGKGRLLGIWKDVLHPWIWEILLCGLSSALLVAIAVILAHVDKRPQEEWSLQITLNSLINILSTLFRACLASTAAEVISQQKWIWFWSAPMPGRPIGQVRSFEDGSRSSLGALKLLPMVAGQSPFVIVPIAVLLTSLSIGPFAQQSIRSMYLEIPSGLGTATLPLSNSMNSNNSYFRTFRGADFSWWSLNSDPRSVLFNALANPSSKDSTISSSCPTGNCSFPILSPSSGITHTSLGVCSTCTDVGSLVQQWSNKTWTQGRSLYSLPNGMQLETYDTTAWLSVSSGYNVTWAEGLMTADHAALSRWAFVNTTVLTMSLNGLPNVNKTGVPSTPVAVTCSLYPCMRSYAAKARGNQLSEVAVDSTPLVPDAAGYGARIDLGTVRFKDLIYTSSNYSLAAIQPFCTVNGSTYSLGNSSEAPNTRPVRLLTADASLDYTTKLESPDCVTRIETLAYYLIGGTYSKFLNGTCSWDTRNGDETACDERWWLAQFWEHKSASVKTVIDRFDAIAGATTNQIRLGLLRTPGTSARMEGRIHAHRVDLVDLAPWPSGLERRHAGLDGHPQRAAPGHTEAVWKSNPLPLLYYKSRFVGPGEPDQEFLSAGFDPLETSRPDRDEKLLTNAELDALAGTVNVKLRKGDGKAKLAGAEGRQANEESKQPAEHLERTNEHI